MRSTRLLPVLVLLTSMAAPAREAVADATCLPQVCETLATSAIALPFDLPDQGMLGSARSLSEGLRAAVPGFPHLAGPGPARSVRDAIATILAEARRAERIRAGAAPVPGGSSARTLRLLQHPLIGFVPGEPREPRAGVAELAAGVDLSGLRLAAAVLAAGVDAALPPLRPVAGDCSGEPTPPEEQADGQVALDLDGTRTLYTKAYALTIDLGGCDVYEGITAGANGGGGRPVSVTIDIGEDADAYLQPKETYALGAASEGLGLLLDQGGDDTYAASGYASMGAAVVGGVGILADLGGDDRYEYEGSGGGFGAQGNATIGMGTLLDLGGDDLYRYEFDPGDTSFGSRLLGAQGAGTVAAIGVLADAEGDDVYEAITYGNTVSMEAQGVANFLPGSTGILIDGGAGSDRYTIEAHVSKKDGHASGSAEGQGVGILDGVGLLLDGGGSDAYRIATDADGLLSGSAGVFGQGFATAVLQYSGLGALVDLGGDDTYTSRSAATADDPARTAAVTFAQGQGFLLAGGVLADLDGSDRYTQSALAPGGEELSSGQGAGLGAASGVLLDRGGADRYAAGDLAQGYGSTWPFFEDIWLPAGSGLLVDAAGRNVFTGPGRNGSVWTQGVDGAGLGIDAGRAVLNGYDLVDGVLSLFFVERPHAVVSASIQSPTEGSLLHGDLPMSGSADATPLAIDWVEWRVDGLPWTLAEPAGGSWASWTAAIEADALADGVHSIRARAWAGGVDSAPATVQVTVERWIPQWAIESQGDDRLVGFDLATRTGVSVDSDAVTLRVLDGSGSTVATFSDGLAKGAGQYRATWSPSGAGEYVLLAEADGQVLGQTALTV